MNDTNAKLNNLNLDLDKTKQFFFENIKEMESSVHVYTHIDADGLSSGAILGKALYREGIPFQITVLKQLEREEIIKIREKIREYKNFIIFSDFGSGQYIELQKQLCINDRLTPFIILDHHIPQNISNKDDLELLEQVHQKGYPWHINPYFYGINGSIEVSGAGICYYFAKKLNEQNIDLSQIALVGAIGDLQNQGANKSFIGLNSLILNDAKDKRCIEIIDDLNFSLIKPLNQAIAYSHDIKLPGLTNDENKTLKFLQSLSISMENPDGSIKTLQELNKDEKQKISSAIIELSTIKFDIDPSEIIKKLIVNRYLLKNEVSYADLYDSKDFSYLLNACGRTNNASLGIGIAMGDRKHIYKQAQDVIKNYKKILLQSLSWIKENNKIQQMDNIQYFFGEDTIPENVIGTISSMLIFEVGDYVDKTKPIFGIAKRIDENVYKISGRAHEKIVEKGVNLSEAIREALELNELDALGGGHPPAAGTKVPTDKIEDFLASIDKIIKKQLENVER